MGYTEGTGSWVWSRVWGKESRSVVSLVLSLLSQCPLGILPYKLVPWNSLVVTLPGGILSPPQDSAPGVDFLSWLRFWTCECGGTLFS